MRLFTPLPFVFLTISTFSPFKAQGSPLGIPETPSSMEMEPLKFEIMKFPSESLQLELFSDYEAEDYLNEILNNDTEDDWDEGFQDIGLSEDFEDFNAKYGPRKEPFTISEDVRDIRSEKQEKIRQKRQVNNRNYQQRSNQIRRGPRYQENNQRRNQNFRVNQRRAQFRQPRVNNRNYRVNRNRVNPQFNRNRPNQFRGNQRSYAQGRGNRNFYGRNMNSLRNGQNRVRSRGRSRNRNGNNQGILGFLGLGNLFGFGGFNSGSRGRGRSRNRGSSYRNQIQGSGRYPGGNYQRNRGYGGQNQGRGSSSSSSSYYSDDPPYKSDDTPSSDYGSISAPISTSSSSDSLSSSSLSDSSSLSTGSLSSSSSFSGFD